MRFACALSCERSPALCHRNASDTNANAAVLGISTNVVYYWIERHHVHARRALGGRLLINFSPEVEALCRSRVVASVHLKLVPASPNNMDHQ